MEELIYEITLIRYQLMLTNTLIAALIGVMLSRRRYDD